MKNVELMMLGPMMPAVIEALDERFTLHKAWEAPNRDALIREAGPRVRGLAVGHGGYFGRIDAAIFERLPALEIVSNFGVGYDTIDAAEAGRRGIVVTNTPDVLTDEVADLTVGLLLATLRHLPQADRYLREGRWLDKPYPLTPTLRGRNVGILGLGRIGKAVAQRLEGFGVALGYHGRQEQAGSPYRYFGSLQELAGWAHVLVCVAPGGDETRGMVDAGIFEALGPDGVFINVGRGSTVDEPALVAALTNRTILSAGLDVFADEPRVPADLIGLEHVVLLPHVGSASVETRRAMGQLVIDNLLSWFSGKGPLTPVPETPYPR